MIKTILVSGAGGTIGSEIVRQLMTSESLQKIIINDISEFSLFELWHELLSLKHNGLISENIQIYPLLGDISSVLSFKHIGKVDCIYHAAAYKHVGLSMINPHVYYLNNINATKRLIDFAREHSIKIIHISTDKAVEPCNHMGYSKRLCEMLYFSNRNHNLDYKIVRFGNVLNSNGSVIPIFQKQIQNGGPVTVTDKRAMRYFMSISDAVHLVLNSHRTSCEQKILVLDMGPPQSIDSLAKNLIEQSGLRVVKNKLNNTEIVIDYIGLREGEKLIETLSYKNTLPTAVDKIMYSNEVIRVEEEFISTVLDSIDRAEFDILNEINWETCEWLT